MPSIRPISRMALSQTAAISLWLKVVQLISSICFFDRPAQPSVTWGRMPSATDDGVIAS